MPLANPQSNKPLTTDQRALVLKAISSRREALQHTNELIKDEGIVLATYTSAIAQLEPTISRTKHALMAQRETVADLTKVRASLEGVERIPSHNYDGNSRARELSEETTACVDAQIAKSIGMLTNHIEIIEENILTLRSGLEAMELEMHSQSLMLEASAQYISQMDESRGKMRDNMELLKSALSPVKNIPTEIWTKIFTHGVNEDMGTYFANSRNQLIPPTASKLSHVSRFWRRIVLSEKALWKFMAIYPDSQWLPSKIELLKQSRSRCPSIPTFIYDLTGTIIWSGTKNTPDAWNRVTTYPTRVPTTIGVHEVSLFNEYSLRLLTYGFNNGVALPSSTPFRQPKSVTVEISNVASSPQAPYLNQVLGTLSTFTRLELVTKQIYPSIALPLSSFQPQLTYLKLDLTTFQPFSITSYLGPNLEELHIRHNGETSLSFDTSSLQLAKLKVLGVTPPDTNFTESLVLPKLDKIILYGPKSTSIDRISLDAFTSGTHFGRVRKLELRNWPLFKSTAGDEWDVMRIMDEVVNGLGRIATLKCMDGHIDGNRLVGIVEKLKISKSGALTNLDTVVLDCCSGITRDNCEAIRDLVGKLEVYVVRYFI